MKKVEGDHTKSDIISFKEWLNAMAGSGVIYEAECRETLEGWKAADWIRVDEYIAPIVSQILADAAETNRPLYEKMMSHIMEAYAELKPDLSSPLERPKLVRIK